MRYSTRIILTFFLSYICFSSHAQYPQVSQILTEINHDSALRYVKQLSGIEPVYINGSPVVITKRLSGTEGNEQSFQFIKEKLLSWGWQVDSSVFSVTGKNLHAIKRGLKSQKGYMLGAHYDAVGTVNPEVMFPGADDNASGTAVTMEAARVLAAYNFPFTIHLSFWDEEEQGMKGSEAVAGDYINKLNAYINLDMVAWDGNNDSLFEIHTRDIAYSPQLATKLVEICSMYQVPLKPLIVNPGELQTDHASFWSEHITAVAMNEQYTVDFNPYYHSMRDSVTNFNLSYFGRMTTMAIAAIGHLASDTVDVTGLGENRPLPLNVSVYPNPVNDMLHIDITDLVHDTRLEIYDAIGQLIDERSLNGNEHHIALPPDVKGFVFIRISGTGNDGKIAVKTCRLLRN